MKQEYFKNNQYEAAETGYSNMKSCFIALQATEVLTYLKHFL